MMRVKLSVPRFICETKTRLIKWEKKEEIWLNSMTKAPTFTKNPKSNVTTQKRHQKFDYTTIADQFMMNSGSNKSHATGVVKCMYIKFSS